MNTSQIGYAIASYLMFTSAMFYMKRFMPFGACIVLLTLVVAWNSIYGTGS